MATTGTFATTVIITKGLACCEVTSSCRSGIITAPFSLFCTVGVPVRRGGGGGGPYPYPAWNRYEPGEIKDFYKLVSDDKQFYVVPRDRETEYLRRHKLVTINFKMGTFEVEKEYLVPEDRANTIINVLTFFNVTKDRIQVTVDNLVRITTKITVAIKNFSTRFRP